jgi:hypothetical protein
MIEHSTSKFPTEVYRAKEFETVCSVVKGGTDMFEVRIILGSGDHSTSIGIREADARLLWHCLDRMAEKEKWVHE